MAVNLKRQVESLYLYVVAFATSRTYILQKSQVSGTRDTS